MDIKTQEKVGEFLGEVLGKGIAAAVGLYIIYTIYKMFAGAA